MRSFLTQLFMPIALLALLASEAEAAPVRILIYGDSLAAGYGLPPNDGFAPQLKRALSAERIEANINNASLSGETSRGGLTRLKWSLGKNPPDIVVLELGANDALRGLPPEQARANLDRMLTQLTAGGITVLLAGMKAPPNLGPAYVKKFDAIYPDLAKKHQVILYPFFLEGVAGVRALNLSDGKHPNAKGIRRIVRGIFPFVKKAISKHGRR